MELKLGKEGGEELCWTSSKEQSFSLSLARSSITHLYTHPSVKKRSQGGALKLWSGHKKSKFVKEDTLINLDREQKVGMRHFALSTVKTTA